MDEILQASGFQADSCSSDMLGTWRDQNDIVVLGLNRKPVNSLSLAFLEVLSERLDVLSQSQPRGLILTSQLDRVFSAGLDLGALLEPQEETFRQFWAAFEQMWKTLYLYPCTTVAAVHGAAPAGGAVMALSCDYRIATKDTKIGLNETAIGMVPPLWLLAMGERILGPINAERALQSGQIMMGEDALAIGYVDELVPKESLLPRAIGKTMDMSEGNTAARATTKVYQRKAVAELAGPESVDFMWQRVGDPGFQTAVRAVVERLKSR